jgi:hypothetical protein
VAIGFDRFAEEFDGIERFQQWRFYKQRRERRWHRLAPSKTGAQRNTPWPNNPRAAQQRPVLRTIGRGTRLWDEYFSARGQSASIHWRNQVEFSVFRSSFSIEGVIHPSASSRVWHPAPAVTLAEGPQPCRSRHGNKSGRAARQQMARQPAPSATTARPQDDRPRNEAMGRVLQCPGPRRVIHCSETIKGAQRNTPWPNNPRAAQQRPVRRTIGRGTRPWDEYFSARDQDGQVIARGQGKAPSATGRQKISRDGPPQSHAAASGNTTPRAQSPGSPDTALPKCRRPPSGMFARPRSPTHPPPPT